MRCIREWFEDNGFTEVETPLLVDSPDVSPNLNILTTEMHSEKGEKKSKALITSPEFSMKKLLAQGLDNIFTITKVFRDSEENTGIHNIEFTMLEWYRKGADYKQIMEDTENLIFYLYKKMGAEEKNNHLEEHIYPFSQWPRLKLTNLFKKFAHIQEVEKLTLQKFKKIIYSRGYSKDKNLTYEQCFNLIFLNEIEVHLPKKNSFFLIDYPSPLAALAKFKTNNKFLAERFEGYLNGIELCNGFSELTNGREQLLRFKKEIKERKNFGKPIFPIDNELCKKLNSIGRAGGNALGIDRLIMILLKADSIDEIISFPVKF